MRFTSKTPKKCEWCHSEYWLHPQGQYIHDCAAVPRSVVLNEFPMDDPLEGIFPTEDELARQATERGYEPSA